MRLRDVALAVTANDGSPLPQENDADALVRGRFGDYIYEIHGNWLRDR